MKKAELFKQYTIDVMGTTVFISSRLYNFSYTPASDIVKDEYRHNCRYFGGLQCEYRKDGEDYNRLEDWLCEIAESVLNVGKNLK